MITVAPDKPIAIVDDDDTDRFIIARVLEKSDLENEIVFFEAGTAALDYMKDVASGLSLIPALVLLDINMPGLTGFDVLRQVRAEPQFVTIPIVTMLTSSEAEKDKQLSKALGATTYLPKQSGVGAYVEMINQTFTNQI